MEEQENVQQENQTQENQTPKTFDEILADKNYQSEFDKRVTKALETAKSKWEESVKKELAKTEASKQNAKNEQPTATPEMQAILDRLAAVEADSAKDKAKLAEREQMEKLEGLKVPEAQQRWYRFEIGELAKEKDISFDEAAAEFIAANPVYVAPPGFAAGQTVKVSQSEVDTMKADYAKAAKDRNTAEMSRLTRLAQTKKIQLY